MKHLAKKTAALIGFHSFTGCDVTSKFLANPNFRAEKHSLLLPNLGMILPTYQIRLKMFYTCMF